MKKVLRPPPVNVHVQRTIDWNIVHWPEVWRKLQVPKLVDFVSNFISYLLQRHLVERSSNKGLFKQFQLLLLHIFVILNVRSLGLFVWIRKSKSKLRLKSPVFLKLCPTNQSCQLRHVIIVEWFGRLDLSLEYHVTLWDNFLRIIGEFNLVRTGEVCFKVYNS